MPDFPISHRISIAPMLDWTDRHERYFLRLISRHAVLYTEMITTGAILHGDRNRHLQFNEAEHPVVIQLGGSNPQELAECARIAEDYGYDEINLNVGCPSDRVQNGSFGACLMAMPELVAECVSAMKHAVKIPVTVKHRTGIDDQDEDETLERFVGVVAQAGCGHFIIHARKAWLQGLSPKENREVPPLNYGRVYRIKALYPQLQISINGGITDLDQAAEHLQKVDGVMIGRAAYHNPYILAEADQRFYGSERPVESEFEILEAFLPYVEEQLAQGVALKHMTRHILGLFQGVPGARAYRRLLSEQAHKAGAHAGLIREAMNLVQRVT